MDTNSLSRDQKLILGYLEHHPGWQYITILDRANKPALDYLIEKGLVKMHPSKHIEDYYLVSSTN